MDREDIIEEAPLLAESAMEEAFAFTSDAALRADALAPASDDSQALSSLNGPVADFRTA